MEAWPVTLELMSDIADAIGATRRRITAAAERVGRDPAAITLVAVTKTVAAERVREALSAGITDVGENRVQEAAAKRAEVDGGRWHLIGPLQSNKSGTAAVLFDVVETVDSERLAGRLARARGPERRLDILLEVELTGLPGRAGVAPEGLLELARRAAELPGLRLRGLMTVAAPATDPEAVRPTFRRLRGLRDLLQVELGLELPELSMGMSGDYEMAVEEGATTVRIGRALFGSRPPG
ncbi:MAG: YggS family pyridoxal phosphate-dependent enzyme [Candidatus Dormibacteria bacterium]